MRIIGATTLFTVTNSSLLKWEANQDWEYSTDHFSYGSDGLNVNYVQGQEQCDLLDKNPDNRSTYLFN